LARKHFRVVTQNNRFLKLNKIRNRLSLRELRMLCVEYAPVHVYFSVLDWLFPERVGRKSKANKAEPASGEYVFDVD
jgi:DNA primase catalytic subunit